MTELKRCGWCEGDELYEFYHDREWGVPLYDDQRLFEFLILETFQAGLSWITVLRKRKNFRKAFDEFNFEKVAKYSEEKVAELLQDTSIIRNAAKIRAAVSNAQAFINIRKEYGSFSDYIWEYVGHQPIQNKLDNYKNAPASTELSSEISKDLKKKGFKFVGPTVVYAHMQATGMVNDHQVDCFRYQEVRTQKN